MHDEFNSIEDIDNMLDQEFGVTEDVSVDDTIVDEENTEEESVVDDTNIDNTDETDAEESQQGSDIGIKDQNDEESAEDNTGKPSSDSKKDFAFAQMRKEISDLKSQLKNSEENDSLLKDIAMQYGYDNLTEFAKAVEDAKVKKEAQAKGVDYDLYRKLHDSNKRIQELEKENQNRKLMESAQKLKSSIDKAVADYELGDNGVNEIFDALEKSGYDVATLLSLPNHDLIIKGVLSDKIAELSKQKQIQKQTKLDNIADGKHDNGAVEKSFNIDDFIDEDLKSYKAENYYE